MLQARVIYSTIFGSGEGSEWNEALKKSPENKAQNFLRQKSFDMHEKKQGMYVSGI